MTTPFSATLPGRTVIALSGPDVRAFLQRLVTVDMDEVSAARAGYGGLLTPQGKILFDFFIAEHGDRFLVDCAAEQKDELVKRLIFYRLRAKVEIEDLGASHGIAAIWGAPVEGLGTEEGASTIRGDVVLYTDPRSAEAGARAIGPLAGLPTGTDEAAYHGHRIRLGLADSVADIGSGGLFPHEANFDQFHGVDFAKGCYVGQEVVSRMEHRGTGARKRIVPVSFAGAPPPKGSDVLAGDKGIGTVLSGVEGRALALVRLDRAQAAFADGHALTAAGKAITLEQPPWARFAVPRPGMVA